LGRSRKENNYTGWVVERLRFPSWNHIVKPIIKTEKASARKGKDY